MRKAALCLVVVLAVWKLTSWKAIPQWHVIMEQHTIGYDRFLSETLFTPQNNTPYRVSAACSAPQQQQQGQPTFTFAWTDQSGNFAAVIVTCSGEGFQLAQQAMFVMTPKPGFPVYLSSGGPDTFNGFFTIEALE